MVSRLNTLAIPGSIKGFFGKISTPIFWGAAFLLLILSIIILAFVLDWLSRFQPTLLGFALVLVAAAMLALFPLFLQRSFDNTKKARIRGDVWTDLIALGYWTKLNYSASVNSWIDAVQPKQAGFAARFGINLQKAEPNAQPEAQPSSLTAEVMEHAEPKVPAHVATALSEFSKRFEEHYGRTAFDGPLFLLCVLYFLGWVSVLIPISSFSSLVSAGISEAYLQSIYAKLGMVSASFLGAYCFSAQSLFRRYVRSDFKPSAINQASLRLITAGIIALLLSVVMPVLSSPTMNRTLLLSLGFFSGIFALQILEWIWEITVKRTIGRQNRLGQSARFASVANTRLTELDGLDTWHEDRLDESGINYVRGLATVDFLDLLLAIRLPTETLVDWVDQAILRTHISRAAWDALLSYTPIRTASDLLDVLSGALPEDKTFLARLLSKIDKDDDGQPASATVDGDNAAAYPLHFLVKTLEQDPNIAYIRTYRRQQSRAVAHQGSFPEDWPIPWKEHTSSRTQHGGATSLLAHGAKH